VFEVKIKKKLKLALVEERLTVMKMVTGIAFSGYLKLSILLTRHCIPKD